MMTGKMVVNPEQLIGNQLLHLIENDGNARVYSQSALACQRSVRTG
jgi:hypothetical protein